MSDLTAGIPTARELATHFMRMIQTGDFSDAERVFSADVVTEWPQSNERIVGRDNLMAIFANYPGGTIGGEPELHFTEAQQAEYVMTPMFTVLKPTGTPDTATGVTRARYPDGSEWYVVVFIRAHEGQIEHTENYFAPVYPAPEWRAEWVQPMETPSE